ncbi:MAG: hypothetical protein IPK00_14030 [Deltaproteobacteria bacterium]|nr:hypothetical protein [Deltaproteobacteria bacterium]
MLEAIPIQSVGAFVNTEILVRARAAGFRIKQVPVSHRRRRSGRQSGAHPRVIARALFELVKLQATLGAARPAAIAAPTMRLRTTRLSKPALARTRARNRGCSRARTRAGTRAGRTARPRIFGGLAPRSPRRPTGRGDPLAAAPRGRLAVLTAGCGSCWWAPFRSPTRRARRSISRSRPSPCTQPAPKSTC